MSRQPHTAMIPFEEIDDRLATLKKDRKWLAEITGRSEGSIRSALAPNSPPKNRTALLQKALSDAIEREEAARGHSTPMLNGTYEIRQTKEQADRTDRASRAVGSSSLADFCLQAITHRTDEILNHRTDPCDPEHFIPAANHQSAAPQGNGTTGQA